MSARASIDPISITYIVLGIGVGAILWYSFRKLGAVRDAAAGAIAGAIVDITHDPIEVLGRVVLPDGTKVPISALRLRSGGVFDYRSVSYRLTARRPDNDYDAARA